MDTAAGAVADRRRHAGATLRFIEFTGGGDHVRDDRREGHRRHAAHLNMMCNSGNLFA
jgi:hypothetical protein